MVSPDMSIVKAVEYCSYILFVAYAYAFCDLLGVCLTSVCRLTCERHFVV